MLCFARFKPSHMKCASERPAPRLLEHILLQSVRSKSVVRAETEKHND